MEILTQYYTENGQIIARAPDMAKREFYRDLCTHTFNEMFVAGKEFSGPTYTSIQGCEFYNYGGGSGEPLLVVPSGDPFIQIEGRDGRKAITTASTEIEPGSCVRRDTTNGFGIIGDVSACLIFRTPSDETEGSTGPYMDFNFYSINTLDDSIKWNSLMPCDIILVKTSFYKTYSNNEGYDKSQFINLYSPGSSNVELGIGASFLSDGDWHIAQYDCLQSGNVSFKIDGTEIYSFNHGQSISRFYRPYIEVILRGASTIENKYAMDSGLIKKI